MFLYARRVCLMLGVSVISAYATVSVAATAPSAASPSDAQFADAVINVMNNSAPASLMDAFAKGKSVTQNPAGSGAVVCIQSTPDKKIYRSHSTNPSAAGIVTMQQDVDAFTTLLPTETLTLRAVTPNPIGIFPYATNDSFVFSLPSDASNPQSPLISFPGKIVYQGLDGYCVARYVQSTAPSDAEYPDLVFNYTERKNATISKIYKQAASITPSTTGAVVCIQSTPQGLYRMHSTNPSAVGIVTLQQDIAAFTSLIGKQRGVQFTLSLPANADGTGPKTAFIGRVIYSGSDGYCIARYVGPTTN
jgi:hypothetical protein